MAASLRDLKVWQESVTLAGDLIRAVRQATRRETKAYTDRMMLSAASVAERIAEGQARYETSEQREIYGPRDRIFSSSRPSLPSPGRRISSRLPRSRPCSSTSSCCIA